MYDYESSPVAEVAARIDACIVKPRRRMSRQEFLQVAFMWWHNNDPKKSITSGSCATILQILKGESTEKLSDYPYVEAFLICCEVEDRK